MSATLRIITPQAARLEGYVEISVPISRKREPEIFTSMEATLTGTDAVWLDYGNGTFSAARRKSELVLEPPRPRRELLAVELLADDDQRRETKGAIEA